MKKSKRGRYRPQKSLQPVIAGRVPDSLHRKLKQAAKASGRTMSEEYAWRVSWSFDQTLGLEARLTEAGYKRVSTDQGAIWASPGMDLSRMSISIDAAAIADAIHDDLTQALARALREFAKTRGPETAS